MRQRGCHVTFLCGGDRAACESRLAPVGFEYRFETARTVVDEVSLTLDEVRRQGASVVVVDSYALDAAWETPVSQAAAVVVIDDLADRPHDCALLLDQNLQPDAESRYAGLVGRQCVLLLGPRYALLSREFEVAGHSMRRRDGSIRRVLVSYGGSDPTNETWKAIEALGPLFAIERIDVVIGPAMQVSAAVENAILAEPRVRAHVAPSSLVNLFSSADLALGAGGSTHWERCLLGVPSIVTTVAANQESPTRLLAEVGALLHVGDAKAVTSALLREATRGLIDDPTRVAGMAEAARAVMADHAGAGFVVSKILEVTRAAS